MRSSDSSFPKEFDSSVAHRLLCAGHTLASTLDTLTFGPPVTHVYNPLGYAWAPYEAYLTKFANGPKRILFLGMNAGPFGMVQTGVPFGEIAAVRDWLGIVGMVQFPARQHRRRPITAFACQRSEVSGRRLWGLFAQRFHTAARFFAEHLVLNYCPLAFVEATGRNRTPDKLSAEERSALFSACDLHLRSAVEILRPEWVIGIGDFAFRRAKELFDSRPPGLAKIPHPSPASPAANRGWAQRAAAQLEALGVWRAAGRK
jgi:single-strand selective monofunctional uracil DNA glycosylase